MATRAIDPELAAWATGAFRPATLSGPSLRTLRAEALAARPVAREPIVARVRSSLGSITRFAVVGGVALAAGVGIGLLVGRARKKAPQKPQALGALELLGA